MLFLADNIGVAIYSYDPKHEGDLGFDKGDKLKIINKWATFKSIQTKLASVKMHPTLNNDAVEAIISPGTKLNVDGCD